jgi:hypothetical protein
LLMASPVTAFITTAPCTYALYQNESNSDSGALIDF